MWYPFKDNAIIGSETEIHECFNDECCEYSNNKQTLACNTEKGYYGPLCGACDRDNEQDQGFFTRSGGGCVECWPPLASWIGTVALVTVALLLLLYIVVRHDFAVPKGDYSAYPHPHLSLTSPSATRDPHSHTSYVSLPPPTQALRYKRSAFRTSK
jgi:hypothetical protein